MARRRAEQKCEKTDSDECSLPGDQQERVYEPVSLVASACKPTWFPLCLEAGVTQGEECPCHTLGACGCFFWWASGLARCALCSLVNHKGVSPSEQCPSFLPLSPTCTSWEKDEAFLSSTRANPPDVGALRKSLDFSETQFLSCEMERAHYYLLSLGELF